MAEVLRRCDGASIVYESDGVTPPSFYTIVSIRTTKAISLQKAIIEKDSNLERSYISYLPTRVDKVYEQDLVLFYHWRGKDFTVVELKERATKMRNHIEHILDMELSMKIKFDMEDLISITSPEPCWEFSFK